MKICVYEECQVLRFRSVSHSTTVSKLTFHIILFVFAIFSQLGYNTVCIFWYRRQPPREKKVDGSIYLCSLSSKVSVFYI